MKTEVAFGTYTFPHFANKGKVQKIKNVLKEYRKTAEDIARFLWNEFFRLGYLPHKKSLCIKHIPSKLSERYKYTCLWQVYGIFEGYLANLQNQFVKVVLTSGLGREDKLILLALNSQKGWLRFDKETIQIYDKGSLKDVQILDYHKKLAKKIFKHLLKKNKKPRFEKISMHLDSKVVELQPKKDGKAKHFDYWLKLSTLEKRKPIYIPLKKNSYAEKVEGEFLNFCQVVKKDKDIEIRVVKRLKKKSYIPATDVLAVDIGLNPLFATDRGDLIGRQFLDFLKRLDEKITKRMASLQRRGLRPSQDRKFVELVNRMKAFLKNEINRMINEIIEVYKPAKLIVEKLDFRSPELSKRMNRLLQNFGKKCINEKLQRLEELYGIEIVEVNSAYTSQECSSCGYVDQRNRKNTHEFKCKVCGRTLNAQVNGARNLLKRSSLGGFLNLPKRKVLRILVKRYLERLKGCKSAPLDVLKKNSYFRNYLEDILNPGQSPLLDGLAWTNCPC